MSAKTKLKRSKLKKQSGKSTKMVKFTAPVASCRCVACEKLAFYPVKNLAKAFCKNCGGSVEETEASCKRRNVPVPVSRAPRRPKRTSLPSVRCEGCGTKFAGGAHLALHVKTSDNCFIEYCEHGRRQFVGKERVFANTTHAAIVDNYKTADKRVELRALNGARELVTLSHFSKLAEAEEYLFINFFGVTE